LVLLARFSLVIGASGVDFRLIAPAGAVFGVPLRESLRYANVPISTANSKDGTLYIYGYIPVVVAKWRVTIYTWISGRDIEFTSDITAASISKKPLQR
jgi:hypothetical protein